MKLEEVEKQKEYERKREMEKESRGKKNIGMCVNNLCGRFSLLFVMNKIQIMSTDINTDTKIEILTF